MSNEAIIEKELNLIKEELIRRHTELGMKASGDWAASLEVEASDSHGKITGLDYTEYLVDGRAPGKFPPIHKIEKWIIDKRISYDDISISSLAFLIARKIANYGTDYYMQGGTDLVSSVITPQRVQKLMDSVTFFSQATFVSDIETIMKDLTTT